MKHKNSKGFTLIELVLVVSLLGALSFTALPALTSTQSVSLDSAAKKIEGDLQYARNLSVTTGQPHGFRVLSDGEETTYEVYDVSSNTAVSSPYDHLAMQEDLAEDFNGIIFTENDHDIQFDTLGAATLVAGDNTVDLENIDSETKVIEIIESTGLIRTQ